MIEIKSQKGFIVINFEGVYVGRGNPAQASTPPPRGLPKIGSRKIQATSSLTVPERTWNVGSGSSRASATAHAPARPNSRPTAGA